MQYTYKVERIITEQDVYGHDISIPEKFRIVTFRPPCKGDLYLTKMRSVRTADFDYHENEPRFILKRREKQFVLGTLTTEVSVEDFYNKDKVEFDGDKWEFVGFRKPKVGEYYLECDRRTIVKATWEQGWPRIILKEIKND